MTTSMCGQWDHLLEKATLTDSHVSRINQDSYTFYPIHVDISLDKTSDSFLSSFAQNSKATQNKTKKRSFQIFEKQQVCNPNFSNSNLSNLLQLQQSSISLYTLQISFELYFISRKFDFEFRICSINLSYFFVKTN